MKGDKDMNAFTNKVFGQQGVGVGTNVSTWNGAISYDSTSSSLIDLFFKLTRGLKGSQLFELLTEALEEDLLFTLKIIFHARDPRGGKGEKQLFLDIFQSNWGRHDDKRLSLLSTELFWLLAAEYGSWKTTIQLGYLLDPNSPGGQTFIRVLSKQLKEDMKTDSPSLLAKWMPRCGKSLAKNLPNTQKALLKSLGMNEKTYRQTLASLSSKLKVVEQQMSANNWNDINYSTVPSVAMRIYSKAFQRHDEGGFSSWIEQVQQGASKVNAKVLHPHEVLKQVLEVEDDQLSLKEEQWKVLVEEAKGKGVLSNMIPLCDVSGSMAGLPMEVSVALGLLISEVIAEPFKDLVITFSRDPELYHIDSKGIQDRYRQLSYAPWGYNTDFQKVFDLILNRSKAFNVPDADMPKVLLVLSDMQFDEAAKDTSLTNFEHIQKKYEKAGYTMPHIVFWNLNATTLDFPAPLGDKVSFVSGFSPVILQAFMDGEQLGAQQVLNKLVLTNPRYQPIEELCIQAQQV